MRQRVYERWVEMHKMTTGPAPSGTAWEIQCMTDIHARLAHELACCQPQFPFQHEPHPRD